MASFDVDALFTNIPLDETIDICIKKLFKTLDTLVKVARVVKFEISFYRLTFLQFDSTK